MTEKRFWILNTLTKYSGIKDGDKLLTFDEVVELLNGQEERIKELEEKRKQLEKLINKRIKYLKENNFELLERDKYTEIYLLKWVLSIMNGDVE